MGVLATIVELGSDDTVYGILLLLHILSAIVGFGGVFWNGLYAQQAQQRPGPGGVAINQAVFAVSKVAEIGIYLVFVFGVLLVLVSEDDLISFGDVWISLSMLLYIVGLGISHGVLFPAVKKANALAEELARTEGPPPGAQGPPPQVVELEALGKKIGMADVALKVLLVVLLFLMIWKPGFP
jgi:hypothetical protein